MDIPEPTTQQLKALYDGYVEEFDPTPQYAYDDWLTIKEFDEWSEDFLWELDVARSSESVIKDYETLWNRDAVTIWNEALLNASNH